MNLVNSIISGKVPEKSGEALLGYEFADKLGVKIGDELTFMGSTMNGSMAFAVFKVSGTVRFGSHAMGQRNSSY